VTLQKLQFNKQRKSVVERLKNTVEQSSLPNRKINTAEKLKAMIFLKVMC
jgi:hypothetical protein